MDNHDNDYYDLMNYGGIGVGVEDAARRPWILTWLVVQMVAVMMFVKYATLALLRVWAEGVDGWQSAQMFLVLVRTTREINKANRKT